MTEPEEPTKAECWEAFWKIMNVAIADAAHRGVLPDSAYVERPRSDDRATALRKRKRPTSDAL